MYIKLSEAALLDEAASLEELSFKSPYDWLSKKSSKNEMSFFWKMVFDFKATYLMFLRAEREGNFELYITTLRKLVQWYFEFDKFHYSRWLTSHVFDPITLKTEFPDIYEHFSAGFFSFQRSDNQFSQIALDQVHEQNNRTVK